MIQDNGMYICVYNVYVYIYIYICVCAHCVCVCAQYVITYVMYDVWEFLILVIIVTMLMMNDEWLMVTGE